MILKLKFISPRRNFSKYQNFYDIHVHNFFLMKSTKICVFLQQYLDLRPNSAIEDLLSIYTVFNADILILLTTILDDPCFNLFAAEIWFFTLQLFVTEMWLSEYLLYSDDFEGEL